MRALAALVMICACSSSGGGGSPVLDMAISNLLGMWNYTVGPSEDILDCRSQMGDNGRLPAGTFSVGAVDAAAQQVVLTSPITCSLRFERMGDKATLVPGQTCDTTFFAGDGSTRHVSVSYDKGDMDASPGPGNTIEVREIDMGYNLQGTVITDGGSCQYYVAAQSVSIMGRR